MSKPNIDSIPGQIDESPAHRALGIRRRMSGRDIHETHRVSTPLELLFDLTFVVAIAVAAAQLHHAVVEHHLGQGLLGFATGFFAIWWAWMNYTWFASAYDTDDARFRLMTMTQMVGALILAAGIPKAAGQGDFATVTIGYVVMRIGLVAMWWRVAQEHPQRRDTAMRYVIGILIVQVLWLLRLALPLSIWFWTWLALVIAELCVPMWAAKKGHTPWHAHHIAERYGLFTIIVLGEGVLGASNAIAGALETQGWSLDVALVGFGTVSLILALWWVYFLVPSGEALHHHRERAFKWGYGHIAIFGSLAALGAFIGVLADQIKLGAGDVAHGVATGAAGAAAGAAATAHAPLSPTLVIGLVAAAVALYLASVWWLNALIARHQAKHAIAWVAAFLVLAAVVAAVAAGLKLAWALPLLSGAPIIVILAIERGRR